MITVRPMTSKDVVDVGDIERVSFPIPEPAYIFGHMLHAHATYFFIAEKDEIIVGYAGYRQEPEGAHILRVVIHPDHRRQGIGETLLLHIIDEVKWRGAMFLEVRYDNVAAQELYWKYSFQVTGTRLRDRGYMWRMEVQNIPWNKLEVLRNALNKKMRRNQ